MSAFRTLIAFAALTTLFACANYRPLVDMRGVDPGKYESDLADCQRYAQLVTDPGVQAGVGAAVGALFGAAVAAAAGSSYDRYASARVGAVLGAAGGAGQGAETQINVVRNCMRGRGYSVLN